ncbi:MAG: hypothetical protein H0Z37_05500 [Firmicutes bacterium]|nr:hypothetical protein [Bacillota bacterium]
MRWGRVSVFELFWLFLVLSWIVPVWQRWQLIQARRAIIRRLQRERGSRIITLIHRQESMSVLGLLSRRFIDIEDSEQVLRAIRNTPKDVPIDVILHTPGGLVLASEQIARALKKHPARTAVFIPHYAMSGGTMIALAADELWMDEHAVVGPIDPQLGSYPAASILKVVEEKNKDKIDDRTLIMADMARKAMRQVEETVYDLVRDKFPEEKAREIARTLTEGRWTHDYPISCEQLNELGVPVKCDLPPSIYQLMELYPQPPGRRPSVTYSPLPIREAGRE